MNREDLAELDASDPLADRRARFALPADTIYLVGNSLGAAPKAAAARVDDVVRRQWGERLVRSWNESNWTEWPRRIGAKIARLIGAQSHEVICTDSTSINLFKVVAAALRIQRMRPQVRLNERRVILSERTNFPTDLYILQGLVDLLGEAWELRLVDFEHVLSAIDDRVAVVALSHVNYRTGARHDMHAIARLARERGALTVWDLAHSAGAIAVDLTGARADFAVGCGYKYLNGGPGAPGFVYASERHAAALADQRFAQPLAGWFGHKTPFAFAADYEPAPTIDRFAVGTPSIIGLAALECGVDELIDAGIGPLRDKSTLLTSNFVQLADQRCAGLGLELLSPRDPERRGSQVCFAHPRSMAVMQALIARGVLGDVRDPESPDGGILRFGFAPLYVRHVDVWDAVEALRETLATVAVNGTAAAGERTGPVPCSIPPPMSTDQDRPAPALPDPAEYGARLDVAGTMSYGDYLHLDQVLGAQHPRSSEHDEWLFIIQHQTSELWMKLVLIELRAACEAVAGERLQPAFKMMARVARIAEQLIGAWTVLGTLTPSEYGRLRPHLGASSGFQSWQYREIEFLLGNRNPAMLRPHAHRPEIHQRLVAAMRTPSLYDQAIRLLARRGFAIAPALLARDVSAPHAFDASLAQAWLAVYRAPEAHWDVYELAEELVDLEEAFRLWRYRHLSTVERIIGAKPGTGGSTGVGYLRRMLDVALFPELWQIRSDL